MLMSNDQRSPRGRSSREYDFRRWGEDGTGGGYQPEDELTDTGSRPSPSPRGRPSHSLDEQAPDLPPFEEFDHMAGGEAQADEPHRFDISGYREGLYGGPGAELIGHSELGGSWDAPDPQRYPDPPERPDDEVESSWEPLLAEPDIPAARDEEFAAAPPAQANSLVRPYTRTGGRTRSDYDLAVEALVSTSAQGMRSKGAVSPEQQSICGLCVDTRSVAEVAAHLRLPLGVARVLIGDMAGMGLVMVHQSSTVVGDRPSMEFLERVLSGLRRL